MKVRLSEMPGGGETLINDSIQLLQQWFFHYEDISTGEKWTQGPYKNKTVQGGLNNQAALLVGEVNSATAATHTVIGSSNSPAQLPTTIADIDEVFRKAITSKSRTGAMVRLRTFLLASEANGDHQCVGIVARATNQKESGDLLNLLVRPFSKTSNTVLTIEVRNTFKGAT